MAAKLDFATIAVPKGATVVRIDFGDVYIKSSDPGFFRWDVWDPRAVRQGARRIAGDLSFAQASSRAIATQAGSEEP